MKTKLNMCFLAAMVVALVWALPVHAGKATLSEAELDEVTAAGQPKIVLAEVTDSTGANNVTFTEVANFDMNLGNGAQNNLRGLTVNNILGENEVANALNIASTAAGTGAGTEQNNVIQQSWGSVLDWSGATGSAGSTGGATIVITGGRCVFGPCVVGASGANGGNARRLSAFGDVIIHATGGIVTVDVLENNTSSLFLGHDGTTTAPQAQSGLATLVLNNVVGMNQVANGVNIIGSTVGPPQVGATGGAPSSGIQTNVVDQFRGSPLAGAGSSFNAATGAVTLGTIHATRN